MIHIIFGAPGAGKSSLNTYFLKESYFKDGRTLQAAARAEIARINAGRSCKLTPPDKPPIYADYKVRFSVGYEEYFEPYYINGFYFGLPSKKMPTLFLPPCSKIFLSESQRYYNSRKSQTFPDHVSRAYEMHRHYGLDIYLDVQRLKLIDPNVRELCKHFIEVLGQKHVKDGLGRIVQTTFLCREFDNWLSVEDYLEHGTPAYREKQYIHKGNIFSCFDSFSFSKEFLPDEGRDFHYLKFLDRREISVLPDETARFYDTSEPPEYRKTANKREEKHEREDGRIA